MRHERSVALHPPSHHNVRWRGMRSRSRLVLRQLARIREARAILFLALLLGIFLALSLVVHSPALLQVDQEITIGIQRARHGSLDLVARSLTFCGNTLTLVVAGTGAAATFWLTRRRWAALLSAATLLGLPLNMLIKELVGRPRPEEGVVAVLLPVVGLSFPSGHAMISVMVYGFVALMAWVHIPRKKPRLYSTAGFAALAVGISLSRVYLGAHWLSDVIGGWTAGLFFLLILAEIYKAVATRELAARA
jgi:undecaprenyl-diphosphatase